MLNDTCNEINQKVTALTDCIESAKLKVDGGDALKESEIRFRVKTLKEQLVKIDEYMLKIEAMRHIAEAHLKSRNLQTIEAPAGYRVNLNRLRDWVMRIMPLSEEDPTAKDDPYAMRVYLTARCDECFLMKKKAEFETRIKSLEGDEDVAN